MIKQIIAFLCFCICFPWAIKADSFYREQNVSIAMRDGIVLKADIWRPQKIGRFPTLIYRTPYNKEEEITYNKRTFANAIKRGYALVVQDVRGRYASQGEFIPYQNEGKDGYDTIEWAAGQSWSTGKIGTFGLSYPGAVQWLAAVENPPHLKAMVPAMCFSNMNHFIHFGGVFELAWTGWIWNLIAADTRARKKLPGPKTNAQSEKAWQKIGEESFTGHVPLLQMPHLKKVAPYYYEWIRHGPYDPWWQWGNLYPKYKDVRAAVLNLSGWHDESYGPDGAITGYLQLKSIRKKQKTPRVSLLMGPWTHGAYETELTYAGKRKFGPQAKINYDTVVLNWLDYHLRGIDHGIAKAKPIKIFIMGKNKWRQADSWPLKNTQFKPIFLGFSKKKRTLSWQPSPSDKSQSFFISNPAQPVRDEFYISFGAYDLRKLKQRKDVLTFESQPLTENLEVAGPIKAKIYLSANVPDTDLFVQLLDVAPDGTAFNLMSPGLGVLRASYRYKTKKQNFLTSGEVVELTFDKLVTANMFKKGHRLRLCIMATFYPTYARNLHSGKHESVSAKMRIATINIHHSLRYRSRIILPIISK